MVTKTEAIRNFLSGSTREDLAELYDYNMEVQINVAQDGGERVDGDFKGRAWHGYTDHLTTWKPIRIPWKAATDPYFTDSNMTWDLAQHAEAIGMTGWDWANKCSRWIAFDFDAIVGHSEKNPSTLTIEELETIKETASSIPWVTIRKSTSGRGLHIYVFVDEVETKTHTEHAALARAVLGKMAALTGYDFRSKVDCCGGNMWVWHRKMSSTDGLILIKSGTVLKDIPPNWRDHIDVINNRRKRNLPKSIADLPEADKFEDLINQRVKIPLDSEHKSLITYLENSGALWWWDNDLWLLVTHTTHLKDAHRELSLKGIFETVSTGKEKGADHNTYLVPLRHGAWSVRRFTPGVQEHLSWTQDGQGWTRCYLNRKPDLLAAASTFGGIESPQGGFVFREAENAMKAAEAMGLTINIGTPMLGRQTILKKHKDGRLVATVERDPMDKSDEMQNWLALKDKPWTRIFSLPDDGPDEVDTYDCDDVVRHIITTGNENYGWAIKAENMWRLEPLAHVQKALGALGFKFKEINTIIGSAVFKAWRLVNKPFEPEFPGDREWNRGAAQLKFNPTVDTSNLNYPYWLSVLEHCGSGLDQTIKRNPWCKVNNILNGCDYLKIWLASLFQRPTEPLPYLFFYGPQDSGKSIFWESISELLTVGVKRADVALLSQQGFNKELEGAILCVLDEVDLRKNKVAYNRIKDWTTGREMVIHEKGMTPYHIPNTAHFVHCITKDQWVLTNQGPRQVEDITDTETVIVTDSQEYKTKGFFKTAEKQVLKIETFDGFEFKCTNDHLVKVNYDGIELWQEAGKLKSGDKLCLNKHRNISWDGTGTWEDGYILGWLFGDGTTFIRKSGKSIGKVENRLLVFPGDESVLETLINCFTVKPNINRNKQANHLVLTSKHLNQLCKDFGVEGKKVITKTIQQASSEFLVGFISAFFDTDGTCVFRKRGCYISITQSNKETLQILQRLLLYFGINSHIRLQRKGGIRQILDNKPSKVKDAYELIIRNKENLEIFRSRIDLQHYEKQEKLKAIVNSWTRKAVEDKFLTRVVKIEEEGVQEVYDITVPDAHAFSCNGLMLHNCANDHNFCPVFPGDTRIVASYVKNLDFDKKIPRRKFLPLLMNEAPDFLAELLNLDIPESNDRLSVPVVETEDKIVIQRMNQTALETFIEENCVPASGYMIKFSEFYDKFREGVDPAEAATWTKIAIGKGIPPQFLKARSSKDSQYYIGNIAWLGTKVEDRKPFILLRRGSNDFLALPEEL